MSGGVNRIGQRADKFLVRGIKNEQRSDGTYVLHRGRLLKDVIHYTLNCPECRVAAYLDEKYEPICPDCGMICNRREDRVMMPEDETAWGRCNGGDSGVPALNDARQSAVRDADKQGIRSMNFEETSYEGEPV